MDYFGDVLMPRIQRRYLSVGAIVIVSAGALPAAAATVNLTGSGQMAWTAQYLGSAGGNTQSAPNANASPPTGNNYALSLPGQYAFLDQFTSPQTSVLSGAGTGSSIGTYAFEDVYEFSLTAPAAGDALTTSLYLQPSTQLPSVFNIDNLQFRLFEVSSSSTPPSLGVPAGSTPVTAWKGIAGNDNGATISASFNNVSSGTYFLQVAGTADGTAGGTYVGQLNLSPVPIPAALPLLLSGVLGVGLLARRRKAA
jgi:hypothetical protein